MIEHIERFDRFAAAMAEQGILTAGNDHLGHGWSVTDPEHRGYFGEPDGNLNLLSDMRNLQKPLQEEHPGVPYFIMGHSMGSFLVLQYMAIYGNGISGAIIMGTGYTDSAKLLFGQAACTAASLLHGEMYRSETINNMAVGSYERPDDPDYPPGAWLTRDREVVKQFHEDKLCQFIFTVNGYKNMLRGIQKAQSSSLMKQIPKDLPVLIVSGAEDPVGDFGKGPKKLEEVYKSLGMTDVTCKLYPEDRHEILNEPDKETVDSDILEWMNARMQKK